MSRSFIDGPGSGSEPQGLFQKIRATTAESASCLGQLLRTALQACLLISSLIFNTWFDGPSVATQETTHLSVFLFRDAVPTTVFSFFTRAPKLIVHRQHVRHNVSDDSLQTTFSLSDCEDQYPPPDSSYSPDLLSLIRSMLCKARGRGGKPRSLTIDRALIAVRSLSVVQSMTFFGTPITGSLHIRLHGWRLRIGYVAQLRNRMSMASDAPSCLQIDQFSCASLLVYAA